MKEDNDGTAGRSTQGVLPVVPSCLPSLHLCLQQQDSKSNCCKAGASSAHHEPRSRVEFFLHPQVYTSFFLISIPPLIGGHAMYALILTRRRWLAIVCLFRSAVHSAVLLILLVLGPLQLQGGVAASPSIQGFAREKEVQCRCQRYPHSACLQGSGL